MNLFHHVIGGKALVAMLVLLASSALGSAGIPTALGAAPATPSADDWSALRRPLRFPELVDGAPCPRSEGHLVSSGVGFALGNGPVYVTLPFIGAFNDQGAFYDQGTPVQGSWFGAKAIWYVAPPESDQPILIRGGQLDGSGEVRFVGRTQSALHTELTLDGIGGSSAYAPGWNLWTSGVYVQAPGCYAFQIDRADDSDVVVFEAVGQ